MDLPSGNLLQGYCKWPIEIEDLPSLKRVSFQFANRKLLVHQRLRIESWEDAGIRQQ